MVIREQIEDQLRLPAADHERTGAEDTWLADLDRRFEQLGEEEAVRLFQVKNDDVGSVCAFRFDPCIAGFTE